MRAERPSQTPIDSEQPDMQQHDLTQAHHLGVVHHTTICKAKDQDGYHLLIYITDRDLPKTLITKTGNPRLFKSIDAAVNACRIAGIQSCTVDLENEC